ncbi:class I SAM-dependent methyltransferase [Synechocystis sp. PCC 7509]|uniref:class I SAM-dependent methyltransferase n=1 Tax=Synechocystis sp. PCC 7509 TaxID=927677 RepID=UPI0002ABEA70|nr:class I SAM-dependent methyltransferase [Synechocystis sp. PCC 7509]
MNTDIEWEKWGKKDPYFAVLIDKKFRNDNITSDIKSEFFESGRKHISHVLQVCRDYLNPDFSPKKALDFGCGTGRLVIPLAEVADHAVGMDISDSMLKEAQKNCEEYSVKNVSLLKSDDDLSALDGRRFDFIHSYIVLQHIPVARGRRIFTNLLNHLEDSGIGVIHFTYAETIYSENYGASPSGIGQLFKILKKLLRRSFLFRHLEPEMQMNSYNVNELLFLMQKVGIRNFHVEFKDHAGALGIFVYFMKPQKV